MCLLIDKNENVKIASTDIKVYKLLVVKEDGKLVSPWYEADYQIGAEKTAIKDFDDSCNKLFNVKQQNPSLYLHNLYPSLHTGLHSYSSIKEAKCWIRILDNKKLFEAIIPKGSRYLCGISNEILSEKLKIIKKVTIFDVFINLFK